jgi:PKD repeat protein
MISHMTKRLKIFGAGLALLGASCVSSTDIPDLTGPSEMALSVGMTATPNTITQDGASQSTITLTARNAQGAAVSATAFRLDMLVGGVATDYGTLSSRTIVTASDGRATVIYTAPPGSPNGAIAGTCIPGQFSPALPGTCVTIAATPIGTIGFQSGTNTMTVEIHLVPIVVIPVPGAPIASFTMSATTIKTDAEVFFNGSSSTAAPGRTIIRYDWDWGDGTRGVGITEDHDWVIAGTYFVTLTVTDDAGNKGSTTKSILVTP